MQVSDSALDWLLEDDDPSVRYRTLTELLGRGATEREPAAARMAIPDSPAVAAALEPLAADGSWQYAHRDQPNRYLKFVTASLSYIAELGLDRDDPRASSAVEHLFSLQQEDGDFFRHYSCYNGLILRTLNRLGFRDDRRTARLRELLLNSIRHDGGFHCDMRPKRGRDASPPHKSCIKGSLKALLAFAEDPELRGTEECEMVAGYFLRRHVCFRTDDLSTPVVPQLLQLSFPIIYRPGLVEALYAMSALGYGRRPEMDRAWASLAGRQRPDGRFALEASVNWPHLRTTPRGHANKWITLYACLALKHRERRTAAKGNGQGAKENGGRQTTTTGGSKDPPSIRQERKRRQRRRSPFARQTTPSYGGQAADGIRQRPAGLAPSPRLGPSPRLWPTGRCPRKDPPSVRQDLARRASGLHGNATPPNDQSIRQGPARHPPSLKLRSVGKDRALQNSGRRRQRRRHRPSPRLGPSLKQRRSPVAKAMDLR